MQKKKQTGRSMLEMLGVLAVIGVLSIGALAGFQYAMNKHRANETIHDVMLRASNVPMIDEDYLYRPEGYEWLFAGLSANGHQGTYYSMTTLVSDLPEYVFKVEIPDVPKKVCRQILALNPTDIDAIYVEGDKLTDTDACPNELNTMAFYFDEEWSNNNPNKPNPSRPTPPLPEPDESCTSTVSYQYGDKCQYTASCCSDPLTDGCPPSCVPGSDNPCEDDPNSTACTCYRDPTDVCCTDPEGTACSCQGLTGEALRCCLNPELPSCQCLTHEVWDETAQKCCSEEAPVPDAEKCQTVYQASALGQCAGYVSSCREDEVCTQGVCCPLSCDSDCSIESEPLCGTGVCTFTGKEQKDGSCYCAYSCPPAKPCDVTTEQECLATSGPVGKAWCCPKEMVCGDSFDQCKCPQEDAVACGTWCCENGTTCGTTEGSCCIGSTCCSDGRTPYANEYDSDGNPSRYSCCPADYVVGSYTLNGKEWSYCCPEGQQGACSGSFTNNAGTCNNSPGYYCYPSHRVFTIAHQGVDYIYGCSTQFASGDRDEYIAYCSSVNPDGSCSYGECVSTTKQKVITKEIDGITYTDWTGLGRDSYVGVCNHYHDNGRCRSISTCDLNSNDISTVEVNGHTYEMCVYKGYEAYCQYYYDNGNCQTVSQRAKS